MLHHKHHAGVEVLLRVLYVRQPRPYDGDHIFNRHLRPVSFEYPMPVLILAYLPEVAQDKEVRYLGSPEIMPIK